jgi:hypothetical protein
MAKEQRTCGARKLGLRRSESGPSPVSVTGSGCHDVDETLFSEPDGSRGADRSRQLESKDQLARFSLIRRSRTTSTDWFQRHWLGLMALSQLGLTALFVGFATMYGFSGSTIFFGVLASYNLVALLARLISIDRRCSP